MSSQARDPKTKRATRRTARIGFGQVQDGGRFEHADVRPLLDAPGGAFAAAVEG